MAMLVAAPLTAMALRSMHLLPKVRRRSMWCLHNDS
jgi:hypothetical protein